MSRDPIVPIVALVGVNELAVLLLMLALSQASGKSATAVSKSKVTSEELLKRAASQLERLEGFRKTREPQMTIPRVSSLENGSRATTMEMQTKEDITEAQKRIDDLRASASAVLHDPKYAAIMQDRIKRSFISGIANKLIGGAVSTASGLSRGISGGSSSAPTGYGGYGHSYENQFDIWDFKKAIINTLIQAIKAIGGGAIAGGGALVKGGGYLVAAKGRIISSAGDAISSLGKSLASSAIIAGPKPVYGHPGYSYDQHPVSQPNLDHSYDGPPPNEDAYAGPEDAYNAGYTNYASPSNNDAVDNNAGVLIVKETKPDYENSDEHPPTSAEHETNPNLGALEESFGGPSSSSSSSSKGTSTITRIVGILTSGQPITSDSHENQHQEEQVQYYPEHKDHSTGNPSLESTYDSGPQDNNQGNVQNNNYPDYNPNGQIYDSYGVKLGPSSPQLSSVNTGNQYSSPDQQHSLDIHIQSGLSVPKNQEPPVFKDPVSFSNYNYNGNQGNSEPLKIPILDHNTNHLDYHQKDNPHIGPFNYYGTPNYGSEPNSIKTLLGLNADVSSLPTVPNYQNYQFNSPMGFGPYAQHPMSAGGPVLGVWRRMNRGTSGQRKRHAFSNNGIEIQRSYGYALSNAKLTRI